MSAADAPGLQLYLLGRFRLEREARPVHLPRRKVEALLAYLALHPEPHSRNHLASLFWGDFPDVQARHSLRTALATLRKYLGEDVLVADRETIRLGPVWVDALEFQAQANTFLAGNSPEITALELYQGDLLPDFYDEWVLLQREQLRGRYLETLLRAAGQLRARGEHARAIEFAQKVLAADRANEPAHQHLMHSLAAVGDRSRALRQYEECRRILWEELAVEPSPETTALFQWLKQAASGAGRETLHSNLPVGLSSFIGREREIGDVGRSLSASRLVTLTGPGGTGKTRLALQVAAKLVEARSDGVWLVELAGLTDPALVPQAVASVLGVHETPPQPLSESLVSTLRSKQMLIVLDNCEHLVAACAELSARLLSACPQLQILATSREALGITGEVAWQVPTLSLPDRQQVVPLQSLRQFETVRLFTERAQAVKQDFSLTEENAPVVAEVCQRLDGIPLAIELAAARVKMLSVDQIAARLDGRFNLLTLGSRTALPRHQTLRALLDWSHDLLAEKERTVFRRLSVFAGGFTLAGATAVCAGGGIESGDMLDLLTHLADKSLVVVEADQAGPEPRYWLLETIRQYALEKLQKAQEAGPAQNRHADYFMSLAEQAEPWLMTRDHGLWTNRLEAEHDNLRAALAWSETEADSADRMLRLAGALFWFWRRGGYLSEGQRWLTGALAREAVPGETPARTKALYGAGFLARRQGEMTTAAALLAESVRLWQAAGPAGKTGLAHALVVQGEVTRYLGDPAAARGMAEEAVALFRDQGDRWGLAYALTNLGMAIRDQEDFALSRSRVEESIALWRDLGDLWGLGLALVNSGEVALRQGDYETARSRFEAGLAARKAAGDRPGIASVLLDLGLVMLNLGDEAQARPLFEESLILCQAVADQLGVALNLKFFGQLALYDGDDTLAQSYLTQALDLSLEVGPKWLKADCLKGFAGLAAVRGQAKRAARLWGAVEANLAAVASYLDNSDRLFFDRILSAAQAELGEADFETARSEGRALTLEQAMAYALETEDTG